jgi:hypothetical protein
MSSTGFNEGEVLWIDPVVHHVPELPDGFAFRVQHLLGWGDPGQAVWVRGTLIDDRGAPARLLTLCVPTNQPRAVPSQLRKVSSSWASHVAPSQEPPAPTGGIAPAGHASHHAGDERGLVGPPPGYQRRVFQ